MQFFESPRIEKLAAVFLVVTSLLVSFMALDALFDLFEPRPSMGNIISVEGVGTITAIPDIARLTFSVSEEGASASEAQEKSAEKVNSALALLDAFNIEEADIKTTSYNLSPKYNRSQPCFNGFCPEYEQTIIGYTTSQTVEVKVRDTASVGDVLSKLGDAGVSNLYGPSFTIDDPEELQAQARAKAIEDAQIKAKSLAKDLGVRLVRVTGFWENPGGYPVPYAEKAFGFGGDGTASLSPELPTGENEVTSRVSITYEIR